MFLQKVLFIVSFSHRDHDMDFGLVNKFINVNGLICTEAHICQQKKENRKCLELEKKKKLNA